MNILISGGTGFLGSKIIERLNSHNVYCLKRQFSKLDRLKSVKNNITFIDIENHEGLEEIFKTKAIDLIIHTATDFGRKVLDPSQILDANLILPFKLLTLAIKFKAKYFINTDTLIDKNVSIYATTKSNFKDIYSHFKDEIKIINIAIEHIYGADDDETKFLTFIIKKLIQNAPNIDLTPGEQLRDFVYIDDVVNAFICIINGIEQACFDTNKNIVEIHVGSGFKIALKHIVEICAMLLKNSSTKLNFGAIAYRENEPMNVHVNLSQLKLLGWKNENSLLKGLEQTIAYYKNIK